MSNLVTWAKALADPTRVRILLLLRQSELCVCELCDALDASQSTLSSHLQQLRHANLVTTRRDGKWMYYGFAPEQTALWDHVVSCFPALLPAPELAAYDDSRLLIRLDARENGCCVRGFGEVSMASDESCC